MPNERDPDDERECTFCGLLASDCICLPSSPTPEELELAREDRLSRAEREGLGK